MSVGSAQPDWSPATEGAVTIASSPAEGRRQTIGERFLSWFAPAVGEKLAPVGSQLAGRGDMAV